MRMIVGRADCFERRGWVYLRITANTGEVLALVMDEDAALEFACELDLAILLSPVRCPAMAQIKGRGGGVVLLTSLPRSSV